MNPLHKILFIILFINPISLAQNEIINIWKGKVPGSIENDSVKEEIFYLENGSERIRNVTDPTLIVFKPPNEKANGTAIIICPGGGYVRLAIPQEGAGVARWLNQLGITVFILKYRLPNDLIMENKTIGPLQDVQESIRIVRRNSAKWKIDPNKIGIMGFSAGGHLASMASTYYNENVYKSDLISARPDFSILIYPVITMDPVITHPGSSEHLLGKNPGQSLINYFSTELHVGQDTPPAFIVCTEDDKSVSAENSIKYFLSLKKFNVPSELHIYERGGHGFGLGKGGTESNWPEACSRWLKMRGLL